MGSIGSKYSATNGAQMQRRNFLSSIFATLFAAKTVNAEERKLSPVASEEHKTKFDENTLLDTIKDDPAFSGYSNLLFPRGRTAGLRLREASRLLPYHSYVMPKESAEVLNYMKDEVLKERVHQGYVLTVRQTSAGERIGLVAELDLEKYDYHVGTDAGRRISIRRRDSRRFSDREVPCRKGHQCFCDCLS